MCVFTTRAHVRDIKRCCRQCFIKNVKVNKAAVPNKITGKLSKTCHLQLCSVFHVLFQLCVELGEILLQWKTTEIVPIPTKPNPVLLIVDQPICDIKLSSAFFVNSMKLWKVDHS